MVPRRRFVSVSAEEFLEDLFGFGDKNLILNPNNHAPVKDGSTRYILYNIQGLAHDRLQLGHAILFDDPVDSIKEEHRFPTAV